MARLCTRYKRDVGGLSTLLTTYLIFEAIHEKKLSLKDPIMLSEKALSLNDIEGAGTLPMEVNQYTVEQLLTALLVGNSSTAALALAETSFYLRHAGQNG